VQDAVDGGDAGTADFMASLLAATLDELGQALDEAPWGNACQT